MVDVLGTTRVEVGGFKRINVSFSSACSSSNESSFKRRGLAARYVFDHVGWANLSAIHPCESSSVSGAWLRTGNVLCAEISYALDHFCENRRSCSIDLSVGLVDREFPLMILICLFLSFAAYGTLIITDSIRWVKWIGVPCRHPGLLSHIVILDVIISIWTCLGATVNLLYCRAFNIITFQTITSS